VLLGFDERCGGLRRCFSWDTEGPGLLCVLVGSELLDSSSCGCLALLLLEDDAWFRLLNLVGNRTCEMGIQIPTTNWVSS
jgi:hypothetical protein